MSTDAGQGPFTRLAYPPLHRDAEAARGADQARAAGHAAGYAAGLRGAAEETRQLRLRLQAEHDAALAAAREELRLAAAAVEAAAAQLRASVVLQARQLQDAAAVAALELAEAVLGRELEDGEASAQAALLRALKATDTDPVHSVRLHPADLALVDAEAAPAGVRLVADASLNRGDAVAEYPDGYLDATLTGALARARQALLGDRA